MRHAPLSNSLSLQAPLGRLLIVSTLLAILLPAGCNKNEHRITLAELAERERAIDESVETVSVAPAEIQLTDVQPYRVQAGDILVIQIIGLVDGDPYLPTVLQARVHGDGAITLPVVGTVNVAGRTLGEVEQAVAAAHVPSVMREQPAVYVELASRENTTVLVLGSASEPGLVQLAQNERNPLYAMAQVGGFNPNASGSILYKPIRTDRPEVRYNFHDVNDVRRALSAPPLESGDVLVVEAADLNAVFVSGLVNAPGAINIPRHSTLSVLRAIATAGGIKPYLDVKEAVLVRKLDNGEQVQVDLELKKMIKGEIPDIAMRPGDVLHLPHTGDTLFQEWFLNNILVGPFSVGVRYDPLQQYNTERALDDNNDESFADAIRRSLSTSIPQAVVPPVTAP